MKYTVVGYYKDNDQIFCSHVEALGWKDAVRKTRKELEQHDGVEAEDLMLVSVFRGGMKDLNDSDYVEPLSEFE